MHKRKTLITRNYIKYPDGSVLIQTGKTKVLCNVSIEEKVPPFLDEEKEGWLTAEYNMLPCSTQKRKIRESRKRKISGRTSEIQRLIGRSLRAVVDRTKFPGLTVWVDCDVLQADGGTRTAAITGACIALYDAFKKIENEGLITEFPLKQWLAAISVGIRNKKILVDLDYEKDSTADVDMNVVMAEDGNFVEIQGTAENNLFSYEQLTEMLKLAKINIQELIVEQNRAVE